MNKDLSQYGGQHLAVFTGLTSEELKAQPMNTILPMNDGRFARRCEGGWSLQTGCDLADAAEKLEKIAGDHPTPEGCARLERMASDMRQMLADNGCCPCCGRKWGLGCNACECGATKSYSNGEILPPAPMTFADEHQDIIQAAGVHDWDREYGR